MTADLVIRRVLSACDSSAQEDFDKLCFSLTLGNAILFVDGLNKAIVIDCKNWSLRSVQEPDNERVLQGPREGFNESLLTNLSLLRRRLTGSDFRAEFLTMGDVSENNVCLCYLESCVDKKVLDELRTRLSKVKSSADSRHQLYRRANPRQRHRPLSHHRRHRASRHCGRQAARGPPRCRPSARAAPRRSRCPLSFWSFLQSNEDYYVSYHYASFQRFLRMSSAFSFRF